MYWLLGDLDLQAGTRTDSYVFLRSHKRLLIPPARVHLQQTGRSGQHPNQSRDL